MDAKKQQHTDMDIPGEGLMVTDYYFHCACFAQSIKIKVEFSKIDSIRYKCFGSSRPISNDLSHSGIKLPRNV